MAGAFQANAFQNNAFQVDGVVPPSGGGGGGSSFYTPDRTHREREAKDSLREAISNVLNPKPAVVEPEALPEVVAKEATRSRFIAAPMVFAPIDLQPVADAVAALLAEQQRLAAENAAALLAEAARLQAEDDALAMELIGMLLL